METNRVKQIHSFGQSIWLDFIARSIIKSGELPAVRVGRSFRVRDVDVDTYLGNRYTQAG